MSPVFHGCQPHNEFHHNYNDYQWVLTAEDLSIVDGGYYTADKRYRLDPLVKRFQEMSMNMPKLQTIQLVLPSDNWRFECIQWWNDFVTNGWSHKKPQLMVIGRPDAGKTWFFTNIILKDLDPVKHYHRMSRDNFSWAGARNNHVAVFCDEFDIRQHDVSQWKQAVEGSSFDGSVKHGTAKVLT